MKKIIFILAVLFGVDAFGQGALYRPFFNATDYYFSSTTGGSNIFMATNLISGTRFLTTDTGKLLGRGTAGVGGVEEITLGTGLSLSGTTLNSSPGGTVGTVINTGASVVGQIPNYLDISGTNIGPLALTGFLYGNGAGAITAGTLSGDITSSGFATTLKNTGTAGTYTSVTTDAQGRVTAGTSPATSHNWVDLGTTNSTLAGIAYEWGLVVTNVGATKIMGTDANGATTNVILSGGLSYSGNTLTGFGGTVGTMINSGASVANAQLPTYTDLTGTNLAPITVTNGLTIQGSQLYATNIQANQLGFSIGSAAGNVVNTGASTAGAVPIYSDTTGTNINPSRITTSGLTNLFSGTMTATNVGVSKLAGTDGAGMFTNIVVGTGLSLSGGALSSTVSGAPVGTMVNSGASTATQYPKYIDTTGTNLSPDTITLASADFANQGTTTTVLHGNAAGNPSFGQVALGTDVSGTLAAAQFPALTGDITTSAGALATTLKNTGTAGTYTSVTTDAQGRVTAGTNPAGTASLDQVTADAASSAINNAAFTNQWRWTDPGAGKKSFAIKSTNSTASTTFSLSGQMTSATAIFSEATETTASTGGSGSQDLVKFNTLAASTANPLRVVGQATNIFVAYGSSGQILAGDANGNQSVTYPVYSFLLNQTYGIDLASGGYLINVINGTERFRVDSQGVKTAAGSVSTPAYSFTASTSSGLYSPFTGTAGLAGGGVLDLWVTNSMVLVTNLTLNGTLTASNVTVGTSGQVLTSGGAGNVPSWTTLTAAAPTLDAVLADTASSSRNHGANTNEWYWTDPGASKNSFAIKGTNSTASTTLNISGQLTSATAHLVDVIETTASTSGANSQYLLNVATLASSTANPLRVATRGTEVFRVDQTSSQILAAAGSTTKPIYSFAGNTTGGMVDTGAGIQMQADSTHRFIVDTSQAQLRVGNANVTLNTSGAYLTDGTGSVVFNGGTSSTTGMSFRNRVVTDSSGTVTFVTTPDSGANNSGSIHNATGAVTYATPASPTIGDTYTVIVNTGSTVTIDPAGATQQLRIGGNITTANTGTATSSTQGSTITFVYVSTDLWIATSYTGTWSTT